MADNSGFDDQEMKEIAGTNSSPEADGSTGSPSPPRSTSRMEEGTGDVSETELLLNVTPSTWKNNGAISVSLFLCLAGCINYMVSIGLEVLCMWNIHTSGQSMANPTADINRTGSMTNDTCDPEKSQEDIPYDLIDLAHYILPAIIILFWKFKLEKHIQEYEGGEGTNKKEKNYRKRRTCYFVSLNMSFLFLFHCVECTSCSFLNPNVFLGTVIKTVNKPACPWISIAFQLTLVPVYSLCCWYATKMACVLRRRVDKVKEKSKELFGTDNQTKDPRKILKELNKELFCDKWDEKVWKNISFVMNIMMFFAVILVLLYTHVYISHVKLTLGRWFSHFMRLLTIASLAITPYMYVAFACVRVTEAFNEMSEKIKEAERNGNVTLGDGDSDSNHSDHSAESRDSGHVEANMGDIAVECDIPSKGDKVAVQINNLDQRIQFRFHVSEKRAQWDRLLKETSKYQKKALCNGILSSAYTTRNGVHWTMLGMVGAVAWEVIDHLNAFDESKDSDANKDRLIVTLFGALALLVGISSVLFVLFWQICGCCRNMSSKKTCCPNLWNKPGETDKTKTKICLVAIATPVLWSIVYTCFYFAISEDIHCQIDMNPLVT